MAGPYEGLRLVDLSEGMAGSYAAMLLAELGADVLKIEPPSGNPLRGQPAFHAVNRSKRSVVADITTDQGRDRILDLLANIDIAICDFLSDETQRFQLDYESLAKRNARLIYCSMPPMGRAGPLAGMQRQDSLVMAHCALMSMQPAQREGPVFPVLPLASYGAAFLAPGAIGAALYLRERTGQGQHVEVSWLAGTVALCTYQIVTAENEQQSFWDRDPQGGMSPAYRLYECADGKWLCLGCAHATFYNKFLLAIDRADLLSDPRFENGPWNIDREHRPVLRAILVKLFQTRNRSEWLNFLDNHDVPSAPVLTRDEAFSEPQVLHTGLRVDVEDPELGPTIQVAPPLVMSATPSFIKGPAPRLGEHTHDVLNSPLPRPTSGTSATPAQLPLEGLRVIDLGSFVAGAMIGKMLAEMGADVIKVESLEGDPLRLVIYSFASMNRGKRSIAIDLNTKEGHDVVVDLVRGGDVLIENYRPGVARRLGLDYETLRMINAPIIVYSGSPWGPDGPDAMRPGLDCIVSAKTGYMAAQGGRTCAPVYNYIAPFDHGTALAGFFGIVAALYHRQRTGIGQHVESSMLRVGLAMQAADFISYRGKPVGPDGGPDLLGRTALQRLYRAADGWLMLAVTSAGHWESLTRVLKRSDLMSRFPPTHALDASVQGELALELEKLFVQQQRERWLEALRERGIPVAAAASLYQMYRDPQVVAEKLFVLEEYGEWGKLWLTSGLWKLSACPESLSGSVPGKGEQGTEILAELGLGAERIADLRRRRVVL